MNRHEAHHGFHSYPRTDRELAQAQWTMVLTLKALADVFLELLYTQVLERWAETPKWRLLRRRRLIQEADRYREIYITISDFAREQDRLLS